MKKTLLGILAGAALTLTMASCGDKLLTDEQVQAEITKRFEAQKTEVEAQENQACDAAFDTRVADELSKLTTAAAEQAAQQPATR